MTFTEPRVLGSTGITVGPIGLASSFGRTAKDIEWAFGLGCSYLVMKPRRQPGFITAIKTLAKTKRDQLALAVESAPSCGLALRISLELGLRRMGLHHIDFLVLAQGEDTDIDGLMETATRLQSQGKIRFLGLALPRRKKSALPLHRLTSTVALIQAPCSAVDPDAHLALLPAEGEAKPAIVGFGATSNGSLLRSRPGLGRAATVADCYRFVLSQPGISLCLAGSPGASELKASLDALKQGPLSEDQVSWLQRVAAASKGAGHRVSSRTRTVNAAHAGTVPVGAR